MSRRPSAHHITNEFNAIKAKGTPFVLADLSARLNATVPELAYHLRQRDDVVCLERPTGRNPGQNHAVYQFIQVIK